MILENIQQKLGLISNSVAQELQGGGSDISEQLEGFVNKTIELETELREI